MRLGFDVDGVFAHFDKAFVELFPLRTRSIFPVNDPNFPPCYDWPQRYGAPEKEIEAAWEAVRASETFWLDVPVYAAAPGVLARLDALSRLHDIYFITCRQGNAAKAQTEEWLLRQGVRYPTALVVTSHLQKAPLVDGLKLHAYIDDRLDTLTACLGQRSSTKYFLMKRPWNQTHYPNGFFERELWLTHVASVHDMLDRLGV